MPIFKTNNFQQIGVSLEKTSRTINLEKKPTVKMPAKISMEALTERTFTIEPLKIDLKKSDNKWGLFLKSISLYEDFEGFLANLFGILKPNNEIYFTSIAWDYSGNPPFVFPPKGTSGDNFIIPMKIETKRIFIGDGVLLFPAQQVVGALNIVILVYECDKDVKELGEQLAYIHDQVNGSKLTALIKAISAAPQLATGIAIAEAVNELLGVVGGIMKNNGDDYVDIFEGSYSTDKDQASRLEKYDNSACGIELEICVND